MFTYMEELSAAETERLRKAIQSLFRQTCVMKVKMDPETLLARDTAEYPVLDKHREFVTDYLEVLGCELHHDPQEHVYYIRGEQMPVRSLTLMQTRILLLIKLIYREIITGEGLQETVTNFAKIRQKGRDTGLITEKLRAAQWQESFGLMKQHQIIDLGSAVGRIEDDTPIYIYNTINLYCSSYDIQSILEEYRMDDGEMMDQAKMQLEEDEG